MTVLRAKRVIDMLAPVGSLASAQAAVPVLAGRAGYSGPRTHAVITGCGFSGLRLRPGHITCM